VSFLIACPACGPRDVGEFRYGGELSTRPAPGSDDRVWSAYLYERRNVRGVERAWWFHRTGCRRWFQASRDTRTNEVLEVAWRLPPVADQAVDG
jgi:heterotetrameric sarcosine oxidase delta subunit